VRPASQEATRTAQQIHAKAAYPKISGSRPYSAGGTSAAGGGGKGDTNGKADTNMSTGGMLFLEEPQTEAEIEMHNLWLAKRQQEVGARADCWGMCLCMCVYVCVMCMYAYMYI
jgi:hypothetical protein